MQKKGANISLKGYDDIFSTDQSRAEAQQERVQEIPLSELHPFEGHPFRVVDDEEMMKTAESVRDFGVLTPAIVRPDPDGGYEIVSGHRRHRASELAGKETMPAIVRDLDDDAAIILMVDANLQRESILPSERAFVLVGSFMLAGCSKDEILDHYNNIVQSAGTIELTGKLSLEGTKEKGIDDYTGTYTADYENFSDTEYVFGGTSIKREAGKELSIDCTLEVTEGTAKVFWISGSDEAVTLIETTGTYSDTITLPDGGNYIGIECEDFTGNIELNIE